MPLFTSQAEKESTILKTDIIASRIRRNDIAKFVPGNENGSTYLFQMIP